MAWTDEDGVLHLDDSGEFGGMFGQQQADEPGYDAPGRTAEQTAWANNPAFNPNNPGQLTLTKGGQTQVVNANDPVAVDALTRQGWMPAGYNNTKDYQGGQMFFNPTSGNWDPLNAVLGGGLTTDQKNGMSDFLRTTVNRGGNAGNAGTPRPGVNYGPGAGDPYGLSHILDADGNELGPSAIDSISIDDPSKISTMFGGDVRQQYMDTMNSLASQVQQQYAYQTPTANAAKMDQNGVPQTTATQQSVSPELTRMLEGEGYNPAILAQMRAKAGEAASSAGLTELAQAKKALSAAGMADQGGSTTAITQDIARRTGDARTAGLRDVELQNAEAALGNTRLGVGYQTQIGANNMQAANQMAVENANRLFAGMSQNLANQQQANMAQFGAENERLGNMAAATAGTVREQGGALQSASLAKAAGAEETNVANQMNTNTNNAMLERERQTRNQNALEGRWTTAANILGGGMGSSPASFSQPASQFSPLGATTSGVGQGILNTGMNHIDWGDDTSK